MTSQTPTSKTLTPQQAQVLADRHLKAGNSGAAETLYRQILKQLPNHPQALHHLGIIADQRGNYPAAVQLINKSLAIAPDDFSAWQNLGNIHRGRGRWQEAIACYRRALTLKPKSATLQKNLGVALRNCGQLDEAENCLREAMGLTATADPDLYCSLSEVLLQGGRPEEALAPMSEAVKLKPDNAEFQGKLAQIYSHCGHLASAEKALVHAIALKPEVPEFHGRLGEVLVKSGRPEAAETALRRAIALKPDNAKLYKWLGIALFRGQRLAEAEETLCKAIQLAPQLPDLHTVLSGLLFELGRTQEAQFALRQAIGLASESGQLGQQVASTLQLLGNPQVLLQACNAWLGLQPGSIMVLARKAVALDEMGDRQGYDALVDFNRFLRQRYVKLPVNFNTALARQVGKHPTLGRSNRGTALLSACAEARTLRDALRFGCQTDELQMESTGPIALFRQVIESAVTEYMRTLPVDKEHPFLAHRPQNWSLKIFATILRRQGHQASHCHPGGWLSGVYYVQVPDCVTTEEKQGWIEFGRSWIYAYETTQPTVKMIQPRTGLMLIFPSYFWHRTIPLDSDQQRISIAFDVVPQK